MTKPGANTYIVIPSESKVTIEIRNIPYGREKHYELGKRLGKFIFNSSTGAFWMGLVSFIVEQQTREEKGGKNNHLL